MNSRKVRNGIAALFIISALSAVTACANGDRGRGDRQGPPPEAIAACEGKTAGDSVSFEGPRGETVTGTCEMRDEQLVAVPEGHGKRQ